jgi:hypothetical protein
MTRSSNNRSIPRKLKPKDCIANPFWHCCYLNFHLTLFWTAIIEPFISKHFVHSINALYYGGQIFSLYLQPFWPSFDILSNTVFSAAFKISLCRRMLRSKPGRLQRLHWQSARSHSHLTSSHPQGCTEYLLLPGDWLLFFLFSLNFFINSNFFAASLPYWYNFLPRSFSVICLSSEQTAAKRKKTKAENKCGNPKATVR